jgi:hypothetical protein
MAFQETLILMGDWCSEELTSKPKKLRAKWKCCRLFGVGGKTVNGHHECLLQRSISEKMAFLRGESFFLLTGAF